MQLVNNIMYLRSVLSLRVGAEIGRIRLSIGRSIGPAVAASYGLALIVATVVAAGAQQSEEEEDAFDFARNLYLQSDHSSATGLFAEFIQNYPTSERLGDARLLLARSYREIDKCPLAILLYKTFYSEHLDDLRTPEARLERAECLEEEGRNLEAANGFEDFRERFPNRESAALVLLRAAGNYTAATRPEQAAGAYQMVIEEYPGKPEVNTARYRLAQLWFATGNAAGALKLLAQVAAAPSGTGTSQAPSALLLSGSIQLFLGNLKAAESDFGHLTNEYAKSAQADSARLAMASFHAENGRHSVAAERYLGAYEKATGGELKLDARLGLADALRRSGQVDKSRHHYRALLQQRTPSHPSYNHIRLGLASSLGRSGDFTNAYNLLNKIIRAAPESAEAVASYRELGTLYQSRGDYDSAITWFDTYLQKAQKAADRDQVTLSLARIYAGIEDFAQAILLQRELTRRNSSVALFAQFELAQILERDDQPLQARREYVRFLERFPKDARSPIARDRVEYLNEFVVLDRSGYDRLFQEDRLKELGGTPRQIRLLDLALDLYEHHDIVHAVGLLETYVAQYPDNTYRSRAQHYLAEGLTKLARQRQLEGEDTAADSLRQLALQEHRILAAADESDEWSQRSQLRLIEAEAAAAGDSVQQRLESGYLAFLEVHGAQDHPLAAMILLRLADAQRLQPSAEDTAAVTNVDLAMETYRTLLRRHPDSQLIPRALHGLGLCHGLRLEHRAAADTLDKLLGKHPADPISPRVLLDLGQQLLILSRWQEAVSRFQELLLTFPAFPEKRLAQRQLADAHFAGGEYAAAIGHYQRWLEGADGGPESIPVELRLAACYRHADQFQASLDLLSGCLDRGALTDADSVRFEQADLLFTLGRTDQAIDAFLLIQSNDSLLAATAGQRAGEMLFSQGRYLEAYATFEPLLETTKQAGLYGHATLSLFRLQRLKEGRKSAGAFAKRFKSETDWKQRFLLEEGVYYQQSQDYERALKAFEKVETGGGEWAAAAAFHVATTLWTINARSPSEETAAQALDAQLGFVTKYPDSQQAVVVHKRMGEYYFGLGRLAEAIMAYKKVLNGKGASEDRQHAARQIYLGYKKLNQHDEAHRAVLRLLQDFPDLPQRQEAEMNLADILAAKGQFVKAVTLYERILESAVGNFAARARYSIGEAYQSMGKYPEAIENYYKVSYYGADAAAQWITTADFKRGNCYELQGQLQPALKAYERIVRREGSASTFGSIAQERIIELRLRLEELRLRLEGKAVQ